MHLVSCIVRLLPPLSHDLHPRDEQISPREQKIAYPFLNLLYERPYVPFVKMNILGFSEIGFKIRPRLGRDPRIVPDRYDPIIQPAAPDTEVRGTADHRIVREIGR